MTQPADGLVIVDKPAGWTSHDVVARARKLFHTRKVGHAGTLDPMATGVLILGLGRATRLLGHLAAGDKEYLATIRLGVATTTDDAEGEVTATCPVAVSDGQLAAAMATLRGEISQVPSSVSAIKVAGKRAYARVRAGEEVELAARPVTVSRFELLARRDDDLDVRVECSTGTYVRALARDLGQSLGTGAHLTALRRTRVGRFGLDRARTLEALETDPVTIELGAALAEAFGRIDVDAEHARLVSHGARLAGEHRGLVGVFGPEDQPLALMEGDGHRLAPVVVFPS